MNPGDRILDFIIDNIIPWIFILALVACAFFLLACPFIIYAESNKEGFELKKDDWVCMQKISTPTTVYVQNGNIMMPITTYSESCNQWNRK